MAEAAQKSCFKGFVAELNFLNERFLEEGESKTSYYVLSFFGGSTVWLLLTILRGCLD